MGYQWARRKQLPLKTRRAKFTRNPSIWIPTAFLPASACPIVIAAPLLDQTKPQTRLLVRYYSARNLRQSTLIPENIEVVCSPRQLHNNNNIQIPQVPLLEAIDFSLRVFSFWLRLRLSFRPTSEIVNYKQQNHYSTQRASHSNIVDSKEEATPLRPVTGNLFDRSVKTIITLGRITCSIEQW